jgi:microcystin-dependent protein
LTGGLGFSNSSDVDVFFFNVTANEVVQNNATHLCTSQNGTISVHFTPTTDTKVALAYSVNSGSLIGYSRNINGWFTINQIGLSAVTNIPDSMLTNAVTVGDVKMTARQTAPTGWLICDGSALSRTTYANLFSAIGTTYGVGDGTNTFNIPDLRGRVPVGYDSAQTEFDTLGEKGVEKAHILTVAEMPQHSHNFYVGGGGANSTSDGHGTNSGWGYTVNGIQQSTTTTGGSGGVNISHNNLQPYIAINYIIKY